MVAQKKTRTNGHEDFNEAKQAALEAYENLIEAKNKFYGAARSAGLDVREGAKEEFHSAMNAANEKTTEFVDRSESYIRERPFTSAGIAFATGFVLSKLIKF